MSYATLIVLTGTALLGACSGMVGSFAVLRRRALMGDALAHAALPGVCLAFLIVGERHLPAMLFGAFVTGVLGVAIVTGLRFGTRIKEDAAMGIVLSVFYGAGIALSTYIQKQTTNGSQAGLNSYILGNTATMTKSEVEFIAYVTLFSLFVILFLFKEFKVVAFDSDFAYSQGWPSFALDLLLMIMVAITVVIGLPAVGVILMAALLIIPAAAARFWTDRLGTMLFIAACIGAGTGMLGTFLSSRYDWAAGPAIVLVGTGLFLVSMFFGPRRGIVWRLFLERHYRRDVQTESFLRRTYETIEPGIPDDLSFRMNAGDVAVVRTLQSAGCIAAHDGDSLSLTPDGLQQAAEAALAYRMVDLYLADYAGQIGDVPAADGQSLVEQIPTEIRRQLISRLKAVGLYPRGLTEGRHD